MLRPRRFSKPDHAGDKPTLHLPLYADTGPVETFRRSEGFLDHGRNRSPQGRRTCQAHAQSPPGSSRGISILGTTGIVKPFSNEAYEQTIQAALSVAASNGCGAVVLSTGGKSERFARDLLRELPPEAFVQIADFFSFAVREARRFGFSRIIHSIFFGKAIKMAQGHPYTHAHSAPLDLDFLAGIAIAWDMTPLTAGSWLRPTPRGMLWRLLPTKVHTRILESVARRAAAQSARLAGEGAQIRLLLFDYDGRLLADVK